MKMALIAAAFAIIAVLAASGCTSTGNGGDNETLILSDGMVIPQDVCEAKGIEGSVLVFHSPGCPSCVQTVPILEAIEGETGKDIEFLDVTSTQDRQAIEKLGMMPDYIPAVVIKCKVYVGYRGKEEVLALMGN